jgi:hypothetical protein
MAVLEYLTQNSLSAYPFKRRQDVYGVETPNSLSNGWFYDILFVSFTDSIRGVYISSVEKTALGALNITLKNAETDAIIGVVPVAAANVVDHYKNTTKSFASYSASTYAIKFVLGPGLPAKAAFQQSFTKTLGELATSAVILNSPKLKSFTFNSYTAEGIDTVKVYTSTDSPAMRLRYNSVYAKGATDEAIFDVDRAAGDGLYDPCAPEELTGIYSINSVQPNAEGAMFFKPSSCYTSNILSENDITLFGNYLDPYPDLAHIGSSIVLQNNCRPKCAPENINAFAHYLNRVLDGAKELNIVAAGSSETRGQGRPSLTHFTASSFCNSGDTTFARCESLLTCNDTFKEYFHEGRTLEIAYPGAAVQRYKILEVLSEYEIVLDDTPTPSNVDLSFRVLDTGALVNMNCAAIDHNLSAGKYLQPYFQVTYTTGESSDSLGHYVTHIAVAVALFNPSKDLVELTVSYTTSNVTQQGQYKIRTAEDITISDTPVVQLGCRQYAFVESVYDIPCNQSGGQVSIVVHDTTGATPVQLGDAYSLPGIDGVSCGQSTVTSANPVRIKQSDSQGASYSVTIPSTWTESTLNGVIPDWLDFTPNYTAHTLTITFNSNSRPGDSGLYNMYLSTTTGAITYFTVDYAGTPVVVSPLTLNYNSTTPLIVNYSSTYTNSNPILQVQASNMQILSANFPGDAAATVYSTIQGGVDPTLPAGLLFAPSTGKLTGRFSSASSGDEFDLVVSAANASALAQNPQTIKLKLYRDTVPLVTLTPVVSANTYETTNLDTYAVGSPLLTVLSDDAGASPFSLSGTLPKGLSFNSVTGKITGTVTETSDGTSTLSVVSANTFGVSATVSFIISWTVIPVISSYPTSSVTVSRYTTYTTTSPLARIEVTGDYTDFNVSGLPIELTLTSAGLIVGAVDDGVTAGSRTITISAYNTHGTSETVSFTLVVPVAIFLTFAP